MFDFISPCKKYKYFAATKGGQMPTAHKYEFEAVKKDILTCKKGWPDRQWAIFRIVFKQTRGDYIFERIDVQAENCWQEYLLPEMITQFINTRYSQKAIRTKAGKK